MSHGQVDPVNYPGFFPILHYIPGTHMSHDRIDFLNYSRFSLDTTVFFVLSIQYNFDEKQLYLILYHTNVISLTILPFLSDTLCHIPTIRLYYI